MPTNRKKSRTRRRSRSRTQPSARAAIRVGQRQADAVIASRTAQLKERAKAPPQGLRARAMRPVPAIPEGIAELLDAQVSAGWLIAEGDSWFDYPGDHILRVLEDEYHYKVESVADAGGCVEDMAYGEKQLDKFARRLEKLLGDKHVPRAILLSGGGNDIAGEEFAQLINAALSPLPPINDDIVRGVIDMRIKDSYITIIARLTKISEHYLGRPLPIIIHGYDHPVPDGRGVLGGWWVLPGPWLRPGFHQKGHGDQKKNTDVMKELIDRFNDMLVVVASTSGFSHVHYLNLRGTLRTDATYQDYWANELHPTDKGFGLVTAKFAELIESF